MVLDRMIKGVGVLGDMVIFDRQNERDSREETWLKKVN